MAKKMHGGSDIDLPQIRVPMREMQRLICALVEAVIAYTLFVDSVF
jgi:hypothetical protein